MLFRSAMMTASAAHAKEHDVIIEWMNTLAVSVTVQERFCGFILKPFYRYMCRRVYTTDDDGRLYIVMATDRRSQLKCESSWTQVAKDLRKTDSDTHKADV